ncbi:MAG: hypothetical protein RLY31_3230 [Bacteroidota bacterium]|jgi:hypothetical protein
MADEKDPQLLEINPSTQVWKRLEVKLDRFALQRRRRLLYRRTAAVAAVVALLVVWGRQHWPPNNTDPYAFLFVPPAVLEELSPVDGCASVCSSLEALHSLSSWYRVREKK